MRERPGRNLKCLPFSLSFRRFGNPKFQTRPFYRGTPWFLAGAVLYYRLRDRLAR